MGYSRLINVVSAHVEGEPNDVITGGVLDVPGGSVFDKMLFLQAQRDDIRRFILQEPRGKVTLCVNLVVPPSDPRAAAGFVIMEPASYPAMSGTNTIATSTVLLETGMISMVEPETRFTLEAPGGLVDIVAECRGGKCRSVTFHNVPSFVYRLDADIEVEGLGTLRVDAAYGGMNYVLVDAAALGFAITPDEAHDLSAMGERIKSAAAAQIPVSHPENPAIHTINQTLFAGPITVVDGVKRARNGVIVSPGRLDRSPCGTGTSARLAAMHARGQIAPGEAFVHESILGTTFTGQITGTTTLGGGPAILPAITGRAWITGFHQHVLDESDPFPTGYTLSDTWPLDGQA